MPFAKLDPSRIRAEALRMFREKGLVGISIRRLAANLGVGPSSLYWHVPDKRSLAVMLSQDVFEACLDTVPAEERWDAWLRSFGLALWHAQAAMPDIRTLITLYPMPDAIRLSLRQRIVDALERGGMPALLATPAQHSVQAMVTGWTTLAFSPDQAGQVEQSAFLHTLEVLIDGWRARVGG